MPQVDLESLVCGGCGDPKVACETTLPIPPNQTEPDSDAYPYPYPDPDVPAESFRIKITDEIDWLDINVVYDREDSTKGTTNPKSHHYNQLQQPPQQHSSKRFSGNLKPIPKAPIIGLPNKVQHSGYFGQSTRRPGAAHGGRIFPQKGVKLSDPGSPKVSCFGKVLSERERSRRRAAEVVEAEDGGCFGCFGRRRKAAAAAAAAKGDVREAERNIPSRERSAPALPAESEAEAPGLGAMKRFVSGRRPASWGGDVETDLDSGEGRVAWSGPLNGR